MFEQELSKGKRVVVKGGRTSLHLWLPHHISVPLLGSITRCIFFAGRMSYFCLDIAEGFVGCFLQEAEKHMVLDYLCELKGEILGTIS